MDTQPANPESMMAAANRHVIPRRTSATYSHVAANDVDRPNVAYLSRRDIGHIAHRQALIRKQQLRDLRAVNQPLTGI